MSEESNVMTTQTTLNINDHAEHKWSLNLPKPKASPKLCKNSMTIRVSAKAFPERRSPLILGKSGKGYKLKRNKKEKKKKKKETWN